MRPVIDESKIINLSEFREKIDQEERSILDDFINRTEQYMGSFSWCDVVVDIKIGFFFPDLLGVFLVEIKTGSPNIPELVWVVVGDLPPAYVMHESTDCPNAICALDGYVGAMFEWVEAVEQERSVEGLFPVNVPATKEWAKVLRGRLKFIDEEILANYQEYLP